MPAPMAHTFFAHRAFVRRFPGINLRAFVVGTHLPGARNVSGHPREHTHSRGITFEDVLSELDAFAMGFMLHSYIDSLHWRIFHDMGLEEKYYETRAISVAWKIVEDELLYNRIVDIDTVVSFFEDILEDELRYGIVEPHIETWHGFLQNYFTQAYCADQAPMRLSALGIEGDEQSEILGHAERFRSDDVFPNHIEKVIEAFDVELAV